MSKFFSFVFTGKLKINLLHIITENAIITSNEVMK